MRLFIAINFNDDTKNTLLGIRDTLRSKSKKGKFTEPENLHLTLAFLGECDASQITAVKAVMDKINFNPFILSIDCIGRFKRDDGDIWWAGVQANKSLHELQLVLSDKLTIAGFTLDKRKFTPHITLGRQVLTNLEPWNITPFGETVICIELMKSERLNNKLTYTAIYENDSYNRRRERNR